MCKTEWNGFKFKVLNYHYGSSSTIYRIEKLEGDWPNDSDLITLCDGNYPSSSKLNFGGKVIKDSIGILAIVEINIS